MSIKAKTPSGNVVVTGTEKEPIVVNLPEEGIDLVGYEEKAGGYACPDRHPSTPVELQAGERDLIATRKTPSETIEIEGA